MKLRFDKQSIRFRLSENDLEQFKSEMFLEERLSFPNGQFAYRLEVWNSADAVVAEIKDGRIQIGIPASEANEWLASEAIGLYYDLDPLRIMIEKDLPCEHR